MSSADQVVASEALFCEMQRSDGIGLSVTSHDRTIEREGLYFEPSPGLISADISLTDDLRDCSLEINGAIVSDAMRTDELLAGRWSEATMNLAIGDWQTGEPLQIIGKGSLRTIAQEDGQLTGTVDLRPARLHCQPCPLTSPECRAQLGDQSCRINMRSRTIRARVISAEGTTLTLHLEEVERFRMGTARWISGANSGCDQYIVGTDQAQITLRNCAPHAVAKDDVLLLSEGCDGRLETCRDRFQNVVNFRGEPHLPGTDFVTRYPGA